jgi:hypothetical protein
MHLPSANLLQRCGEREMRCQGSLFLPRKILASLRKWKGEQVREGLTRSYRKEQKNSENRFTWPVLCRTVKWFIRELLWRTNIFVWFSEFTKLALSTNGWISVEFSWTLLCYGMCKPSKGWSQNQYWIISREYRRIARSGAQQSKARDEFATKSKMVAIQSRLK